MSATRDDAGALLSAYCAAADLLILEATPGGLRTTSSLPSWARIAVIAGDGHEPSIVSPYLDHFLEDARDFLATAGPQARLPSEVFEESTDDGPLFLQAEALRADGRDLVTVRRLGREFGAHREVMQAAREHLLDNERLEAEVARRTAAIRHREEEIALHLLSAASLRDKETGAHVRRIGLYSEAMGRALGQSPAMQADLRIAAPMHDVGKIGIPDRILQKPGRLTADEYEIMKRHAALGGEMLEATDIPLLQLSAEIARHHHERWDGAGYPDGLTGEATPVAARMVAIADVYDALVHPRVYKPAWREDRVLAMLREDAGSHFDPTLVEVFLDLHVEMREIRLANPDAEDEIM